MHDSVQVYRYTGTCICMTVYRYTGIQVHVYACDTVTFRPLVGVKTGTEVLVIRVIQVVEYEVIGHYGVVHVQRGACLVERVDENCATWF